MLFGYANDLVISFVKSHAFDGCREFPFVQAFARLNGPQPEGVIGGSGDEKPGLGININRPDCSIVTIVSSEALAVV